MTDPRRDFIGAQQRMLDRYRVEATSRFVDVQTIRGQAHVLISGEGPPVVMINGIGTPAAMWAPLMAELDEGRLYAVDLPAYGLTDTTKDLIKQPTLVFWGKNDPFGAPETGERMVAIMPQAELRVVGGGHAPWLTQASRIGPIVTRFFDRQD